MNLYFSIVYENIWLQGISVLCLFGAFFMTIEKSVDYEDLYYKLLEQLLFHDPFDDDSGVDDDDDWDDDDDDDGWDDDGWDDYPEATAQGWQPLSKYRPSNN